MLKAQKKISKREIKEDKLVTSYFEAKSWYQENKKLVSSVLTGLVVVVIGIVVITNNMRTNNEKATAELGKVIRYYDQGQYELAINGNPQENVRGLAAIVSDYGSTESGEIATLYLANSYYAQENYDKALEFYLDVDVSDELLSATALAGAAGCYEAKGDHETAATYFERAAFKNGKGVLAPENIFHAAHNFSLAGKKEKAVELYKKLKKDHPTSSYARDIERYIAEAGS
ncbi:MAG TPA: hypothetical protein DCP63_10600 [Bacteroidetes bacterium]|nr:hypothetical protein [Bacteroidota bacterium]